MRAMKFFRILARLILFLVLVLALLAGFVWWRSNQRLHAKYDFTFQPSPVPQTSEAVVAQGKHLATTRGCTDCHGADLAGKTVMNNFPMGLINAPNLTHGKGGLPTTYTDKDWERAVRHGVGANLRPLYLMPSTDYAPLSESDMGALIAYLKSLPPVDRSMEPLKLGPVARALLAFGKIRLSADLIPHADLKPSVAAPAVTADYGKYLATSCTGCHRTNFSGGKIAGGDPRWPAAANLTPAPEGRLTKWSQDDFFKALRTGKRPDGTEINPAMPRAFGLMTDDELKAIWLYLGTLPPSPTAAS